MQDDQQQDIQVVEGAVVPRESEPFAKDPMKDVEGHLREDIIGQAKVTIERLVCNLDASNSARVLRMIETIAEHHREMVASLGLGEDILKRKKHKVVPYGDPLSMYESGIGGGSLDAETFGAQAVNQIGSSISGMMSKQYEGRNIEALTDALAKAKDNNLGDDVIEPIRQKLLAMLNEPEIFVQKDALPVSEAVSEADGSNGASLPRATPVIPIVQ